MPILSIISRVFLKSKKRKNKRASRTLLWWCLHIRTLGEDLLSRISAVGGSVPSMSVMKEAYESRL